MNETDANKIQKIIESSLNALKNSVHNNGARLDEFGNLSTLPQHIFEAEKNQAIDILSEILHYRLPQPLTRLCNDALH